MTQLRPSLSREFDSHLSIRHSLVMSLISFAGSMLLHVIVVWIYHRYKHRHNASHFGADYSVRKYFEQLLNPNRQTKLNYQL